MSRRPVMGVALSEKLINAIRKKAKKSDKKFSEIVQKSIELIINRELNQADRDKMIEIIHFRGRGVTPYVVVFDENVNEKLKEYAKINKISRSLITEYACREYLGSI